MFSGGSAVFVSTLTPTGLSNAQYIGVSHGTGYPYIWDDESHIEVSEYVV
jgi:hypothetical protein